MAVYFLDSSALVKRYITETGSAWVLGLFDPALDNEIFIASITSVKGRHPIAIRANKPIRYIRFNPLPLFLGYFNF